MVGLTIIAGTVAAVVFIFSGIRIVRPVEHGLVERLGKYRYTAQQGFRWIIPVIDKMRKVNITEQMVDVQPQTVITKDNLNAVVDAVVYYKVKDTKAALYNVDNHEAQMTSLARTTLRAVIGKKTLSEANEERDQINVEVEAILDKETDSYGVEVLRVEIQKIEPPEDVQQSMNEVVKAERKRIASTELANAAEIEADGLRRAAIKKAEGARQSAILEAEGKAKAIELENIALRTYFKDEAQLYKSLEVTMKSLVNNSKVVITERGISPMVVLGDSPQTTAIMKKYYDSSKGSFRESRKKEVEK